MHPAVRDWVRRHLPQSYGSVLEVGARDMNGSVRGMLDPAASYTGIDIAQGPGVDIVADFCGYRHPELVELILCLEVLEHVEAWRGIVQSAARNLVPDGTLILTCATTGRSPHSGRAATSLQPGEFYQNVRTEELEETLKEAAFRSIVTDVTGHDLRACAVR